MGHHLYKNFKSLETASSTDLAYRESSLFMSYVLISAVGLIKKCTFLFKSLKEFTLVIRSGTAQNSGYPKW